MKQAFLVMAGLLLFAGFATAQDNHPVVGISDNRPGIFGLRGASVISSYDADPEKTDILVVNGRIKVLGKDIEFPEGTTVIDLEGKIIYPSFIDIYTSYGVQQEGSDNSSPAAAYTRQMQRGGPSEDKPRVADYWNQGIHESYDVLSGFKADNEKAEAYRKAGFGAVVTSRDDGIARGQSALVSLADDKTGRVVLKGNAGVNYSFSSGSSEDRYPNAQYGAIALLRQFYLDGQWYEKLPDGYFYDASLEALSRNRPLPKIFEVSDKYEIMRADAIADEFGIQYIIRGSGNEYQMLDEIKKTGVSLIVPLDFPEAPDVKDPYEAANIPLSELKHWEMAPSNAGMISEAGIEFALTADELSRPGDFPEKLRKAVEEGLGKKQALKALTYTPAKMIGAENMLGAIREGMVANMLVCSGDIFDKDCVIHVNWIQGRPYSFVDPEMTDILGSYSLVAGDKNFDMKISGKPDKPSIKIKSGDEDIKSAISWKNELVNITIITDDGIIALSGAYYDGSMKGDGTLADGSKCKWEAVEASPGDGDEDRDENKDKQGADKKSSGGKKDAGTGEEDKAADSESEARVIYPFVAYGFEKEPEQEKILFRNATVWTLDENGRMEGADVLVDRGKIVSVGNDLNSRGARVIDATGMHLSPGIIDEHSHIAMASSNETGQAITSEVRVGDIIDPSDISIYRQLSGGVTAAHLLHGSANPIGGQGVIIKHRWGSPAEDMKIKGQVGFLKHALGENVKRSTSRYPNSRMGVEHIIRDAYQRALDYRSEWERYNAISGSEKEQLIPPRRSLELEALVDVLEERSFITCHTYVQSEAVMLMRLAEDFDIKAHTLIHFNEAYKVADKMREHGAAGSVFSDWWNYKYEVYEGINYNAATLVQQGVLTCLHSDNAEMARRLNQEAGKTVTYGGLDQVEALKLVTLNPAKILHLDHRMGSIEPGKDADLVLWTDNPLSIYARASMTLVDGRVYFDEEKDAEMKKGIDRERNRIIQKVLKEGGSSSRPQGNTRRTF